MIPRSKRTATAVEGRTRPPHVLIVSYLFPPSDVSAVRRAVGIRNGLEDLGVRTTVLTSKSAGSETTDDRNRIVRAADLRERMGSHYLVVAGLQSGEVVRSSPRWWTRLVVPDITAVSWLPAAIVRAGRLLRKDRPDAVITTAPPPSTHLVGLFLRRLGVPWVADFRDGWTFEPPTPRPYARWADDFVERVVLRSADRITAVTGPLADYLNNRCHRPVALLTNGFEPRGARETAAIVTRLDPSRFSLVYTGSGVIDGKDPRPFLRALARLVAKNPALRSTLEVVFAGTFTTEEVSSFDADALKGVVRFLGRIPHGEAVALQRASDGLLLITSVGMSHVATGKIYEYLAAEKPILALAHDNAATALLATAGDHIAGAPGDEAAIYSALTRYVDTWVQAAGSYQHAPSFDLSMYSYETVSRQLFKLLTEVDGFPRRRLVEDLPAMSA